MSELSVSSIYQDLSNQRKKMQEEKTLPEWFTTIGWQVFEQKYLFQADTYKQQLKRICKTLSKHTDDPKKWEKKFFEVVWNGWLSLSTPVMCNTGTDRGLSVSCSGGVCDDSVEGFYDSYKEIAMLSKYGFGTSSYLGNIRPRGTKFGLDGEADGVVPVVEMHTKTIRQIRQTSRRGAGAWSIEIDHGDFYELCDYIENNPDDLNIGWLVKDDFIERCEDGSKTDSDIFARSLKTKLITGKGYYTFIDRANKNTTQAIKKAGISIEASNLCIAGDQRVVSNYGYLTAKELNEIDKKLTLFDNNSPVKSSKMKLREENVDTYRVTLENGMEITTTDYHGFPVAIDDRNLYERVPMKDLKIGDRVPIQTKKGLFGKKSMEDEAFLLGQYQSDGTQNKESIHLCLWENDFDLIDEIEEKFSKIHTDYGQDKYEISNQSGKTGKYRKNKAPKFREMNTGHSDVRKVSLISKTLKRALNFEKGYVPSWIWESDEATQWQYVRGLLYADGTVFVSKSKGNPIQLNYTDINKEFLRELQIIFQNLGLQASIRLQSKAEWRQMPDGRGGSKYYLGKDSYRLIVGNKRDCLEIERNTGFLSRKGIVLEDREYRDNTKKFYKISSIEYAGKQDVYCPTVDTDEHIFVCQGMKTYNCQEVFLPADDQHSFSCVLSSMNAAKYDEWKDTDAVFVSTVMLDCVAEDLIQKGSKLAGLEKVIRFTKKYRALGLGCMGFHTYLQQKSWPFDSMDSMFFNDEIFKHIKDESYRASRWMAKEWGQPEACIGTDMRNATTMAVAPNFSSAIVCGSVSEGIQPFPKNVYTQGSAAGDMKRINPALLPILKEKGKYTDDIIDSIIDNQGSVQHLDFLSDHEKLVFKTAFEIDQRVILRYAAQRQRYIDQGQSLNLFFSADEDEEYIAEIHQEAFMNENILSLYYLRSEAGVNASKGEDCFACAG